mmetsp:Transcript_727/g.1683  ORF Transcript_727/g.1683 Transcript_727/m.1683 type:complete len:207 (+) Transcript_727:1174-1794(+)
MSYTCCATDAGTTMAPSWSPTMASPGRTATPPQLTTTLQAHGWCTCGPWRGVVEWENTGKPYSRSTAVSRTEPSVTRPAHLRWNRRRNLMSPPTDSHGPTEDITITSLSPTSSNASYSGDSIPPGLSAAMSGRAGANWMVTARPTSFFWPSVSGRAPMMWDVGHPSTHRPSISACVLRLPSLASSSSLMWPPDAGPEAMARSAVSA